MIAGAIATALGVLARFVLVLAYGARFGAAATSLQLLLPGSVLFAGSSILGAGLYAAGRPLTTSATQVIGMIVTVVGLGLFLRTGGIIAAAIVSTSAYTTVFVTSLIAFKRVSAMTWRGFLPSSHGVRAALGRAVEAAS